MPTAHKTKGRRHPGWFHGRLGRGVTSILLITLALPGGSRATAQAPMPASDDAQGKMILLMTKLGCDRLLPGYQAATAARYTAWRQANAVLLAQLEASPDFQGQMQRFLAGVDAQQARMTPDEQGRAKEQCEDVADLLGPAGQPDPRFATPEKTWELFQASLRAGDRSGALSCLIQQAKRAFQKRTQGLSDGEVRKLADPTWTLRLGVRQPEYQSGDVIRNGVGSFIQFLNVRGEWKIATL